MGNGRIARELSSVLCDDLEGWDWGEAKLKKEGIYICYIYVYMADSQFCVTETNKHCKAIVLQLKINLKRIKKTH